MNENIRFEKEQQRRNEILTERPAKVLLRITLPLLFFSCIQMAFQFFDVLTVSKIDQDMVSTVLFVGDVQSVINTIFISLSVGLGIRISQYFGAGDIESISKDTSTIFFTVIIFSLLAILMCIPFSRNILTLCGIPSEMLDIGSKYFSFSIFSTLFSSINVIYFSAEKARGRTKIVSFCNMFLLVVKLVLNILIMKAITNGMITSQSAVFYLPLSTCLSQFIILLIALHGFISTSSLTHVNWKNASFTTQFFVPYTKLTLPIILTRFIKSLSKVICNNRYAVYGSIGLAAFACATKLCSLITTPIEAFQDGGTTVIAANIGNQKYDRVNKIMSDLLMLTSTLSILLFALVSFSSETLISYFASGNLKLAENIRILFKIERMDFLFVAIECTCTAYLLATKNTRHKTISMFLQKIALRIPLLYLLINIMHLGIEAIAISILLSNIMTSIFTAVSYLLIKKKYEEKLSQYSDAETLLWDSIRALAYMDAFDTGINNKLQIEVPIEILEIIRQKYQVQVSTKTMEKEYRRFLVEARIDELEKQEELTSHYSEI